MKRIKIFSVILNFLCGTNLLAITPDVPTATVNITFNLEVTDTIKVDPVYLDFGNILKNSSELHTAQSYFNLSAGFQQDMLVSTSFNDGVNDGRYTKVEVNKADGISSDVLNVYLHNIENKILKSGEYKIPVIGEIREVGDIALGKYEKTIKMNVEIQPILPIS